MPELKKAELIGGTVFMPSPLSREHAERDSDLVCWARVYAANTPNCSTGSDATWLMLRDSPQPDCHLRLVRGGTSWEEAGDRFLHGAPELAIEVCLSSASYDLHQKKALYEAAGVKEYLVDLLEEGAVVWHRLVDGAYQTIPTRPEGAIRSTVFPGLWLDVRALLAGDMRQVLDTLQAGLSSAEHQEFAQAMARRAGGNG